MCWDQVTSASINIQTMKQLFFCLAAISCGLFSHAQSGKNMVTIKGTLTGDLKGYNKIYLYTRTSRDSAVIQNGEYSFSFPFEQPTFRNLYPEYLRHGGMMYQPFGILIAGPGTYYVNSDAGKGLAQSSEVKGPEAAVVYRRFEQESSAAQRNVSMALAKLYGDNWYRKNEKDADYTALQHSRDSLQDLYMIPLIEKLLKDHPDSYAGAFVLAGAGRQVSTIEKKEKLLGMLSAKLKKTDPAQKFADHIQGLKNSAIGKKVANFVLPDPAGKDFSLEELKGKYVLIDFWASWCAPCRKSFPRMREVYAAYRDQSFEIYSVSIDEDKAAWLKAVQEESNPWKQSLDNKNISQSRFAVTGVPSTFLIGPDGTIIASEVGFDPKGGSEIEKKLAELFGKKVPAPGQEEKKPAGVMKAIPMTNM
ncbi:thiol-disulfide isomerase/thioredoxin [Pseudobacter ginsenosidimutans]|uniref:Thiol-disulfide isomerase/thioredoxin n=2 Tax=Pseudobacter ginsenosidimutans TaxID=661488 RepID=A0A4Q7MQ66_9BACT|nr:AhpC/TSA family protein [Pseudobacter ginsenosidimutans]RZS70667.1 thiol-disulfide isomerase/thioredoxin [Pseudobacter ginsenosidimutans]